MILASIIIGYRFLEKICGPGGCPFFWEVKGHLEMGLYGQKDLINEINKYNIIKCLSLHFDNYNFCLIIFMFKSFSNNKNHLQYKKHNQLTSYLFHLQFFFNSSLIFFCWLLTIAILAVVLEILGACPSHIILSPSSSVFSLLVILAPSPPKISGLLLLKLYKFFLISTYEFEY